MLTKIVNGVEVILTPAEEAAIRADWAKADADAVALAPILDQRKANILLLEKNLNNLANQADLTVADIKTAMISLLKLRQLKGDFVSAAQIPTT